jgi:hypothetical protein
MFLNAERGICRSHPRSLEVCRSGMVSPSDALKDDAVWRVGAGRGSRVCRPCSVALRLPAWLRRRTSDRCLPDMSRRRRVSTKQGFSRAAVRSKSSSLMPVLYRFRSGASPAPCRRSRGATGRTRWSLQVGLVRRRACPRPIRRSARAGCRRGCTRVSAPR